MGIDPITFIAQIINLFLLVWILKHFLYRPILQVIDKRQDEINQELQSISLKSKETEQMHLDLKKEKEDYEAFDEENRLRLASEIKAYRTKELRHLKEQINLLRQKSLNELKEEESQIRSKALDLVCQDFLKISEKILSNFTQNTPLDHILDLFLEKCSQLSNKEKLKINNIIKKQNVILINSSKDLTHNQQNKMTLFLKKEFVLPPKTQIKFQIKKDLIFGIEMRFDSVLIDWTIQNYLNDLHENLNHSLSQDLTEE